MKDIETISCDRYNFFRTYRKIYFTIIIIFKRKTEEGKGYACVETLMLRQRF